jgi:hypothetical protein
LYWLLGRSAGSIDWHDVVNSKHTNVDMRYFVFRVAGCVILLLAAGCGEKVEFRERATEFARIVPTIVAITQWE